MLKRSSAITAALAMLAALFGSCVSEQGEIPAAATGAAGLELPPGAETAAETIQAEMLSEIVDHLADDTLRGRGPSTEGDRLARRYISGFLQQVGFEPGAAEGSWEQPFELVGINSEMPKIWSFHGPQAQLDLDWWDDFVGSSGVQQDVVEIAAGTEIVFIGYGITAPEENWDDFKETDLNGKIALIMNNDPDWDSELFAGERRLYYGRWTYKYESAARHGAVAAIIIHTTPSAGYPFQVVQTGWTGVQFELPGADGPRVALQAWVTEQAARDLVALGGHDLDRLTQSARSRDFRPVELGVTTEFRFTNAVQPGLETANVLGLLRGRDPDLRDEVVIYTAHHDHLGEGEPDDEGDTIYNGARDNASGVASVLGVARAFAALEQPPRRSILMLLVGAEEQGLLGSRYFAEHPTVHPGKMAANINVDSANIFGPSRDVGVIGRGKSSLEELLEGAAALQDRVVVGEPFPDKGYYYRSDQFNLAKIGVPALYFKAGTAFVGKSSEWGREVEDRWRATRYHQPSDEVYEEWNFAGMVEDARLAFWVGLAAAEADTAPGWRPGDEFESVRRRMLAEAEGR